ncbi:hypothetical protein DL95DRAFT_474377 [Leptodontidium sp. 2 PMI_412]|nr:hypothetical protein DL95DRAFT_474377 [Leptodontidium sp. 2 PMI_412]
MSFPNISCSVVDRRNGRPIAGLSVILRCLQPQVDPALPDDYAKRVLQNNEFRAQTDPDGWILQQWRARDAPDLSLLQFLWIGNEFRETTVWQMGFLATQHFAPAQPRYAFVDVNFVLHRDQDSPHILLCLDLDGFGACLKPFKEVQRRNQQAKFSQKQQKALMEPSPNESYPDQTASRRPWAEHSKQKILQVRRRRSQYSGQSHGQQSMLRCQTINTIKPNDTTSEHVDNTIVASVNQTNPIIVDASIPADPILVNTAIIFKTDQDNTIIVNTGVEETNVDHCVQPGTSTNVQANMAADTDNQCPAGDSVAGMVSTEPKGLGLVLRRSTRQAEKKMK